MKRDDTFRTLDDIEAKEIGWLWEPLIPYEKTTILEGDPEVGKSYLCMHIAALATTGGKLPDGSRVDKGLRRLRTEMEKYTPDLVVIDTLCSFLSGKVDMGKPTSIRAALHQLDKLFKEYGPAVIAIRHWTKDGKGKAIYRGVGSIDVIGVARTALAVAKHPEDDKLRILAQVKNNIGAKAQGYVYEIVPQEKGMPIIEWRGTTNYSADDLEQQGADGRDEFSRAKEFLQKVLATGPMPSADLFDRAAEAGISRPTLNRAKSEAGAKSEKKGKAWMWMLEKG